MGPAEHELSAHRSSTVTGYGGANARHQSRKSLAGLSAGAEKYRAGRAALNGLYEWELIYKRGPWPGLDDVEFPTMTYVDWFDHRRLHGVTTDDASYTTPVEAEDDYYRQTTPAEEAVTQ